MQSPILLEIPKPCHEDWNNMTPEGRGRFCAGCSKQVVDFSLMTDQEIINYFSKANSRTCGRFSNDQLQRPLIPLKEQKKQTWWMAMMLPLLFLFEKSNAQKKKVTATKGAPAVIRCEPNNRLLGMVAFPVRPDTAALQAIDTVQLEPVRTLLGDTVYQSVKIPEQKKIIIKGKITDAAYNAPVAFATVMVKGEYFGTTSDTAGNFSLTLPGINKNTEIVISSVGDESKKIPVDPATADSNAVIELSEKLTYIESMLSGEVIVAGYTIKHKAVKKKDTLFNAARKIFSAEIFKAYPNPASKGSMLHIQFKKKGDYTIHILNNSSTLIETTQYNAISDATSTAMPLPGTLAGGLYYIRVIDNKKKKQYTDKLIIQ